MQAHRNCQKMLYETQAYKSYLEHRKSHQLLSSVMAESIPMAQEWMGQERICFILKWFIWTWVKASITLCMIQSAARINSHPVTEEFRGIFSSQLFPLKGDFWRDKNILWFVINLWSFAFSFCFWGFLSKSHKTIFTFLTALSPCTFYT